MDQPNFEQNMHASIPLDANAMFGGRRPYPQALPSTNPGFMESKPPEEAEDNSFYDIPDDEVADFSAEPYESITAREQGHSFKNFPGRMWDTLKSWGRETWREGDRTKKIGATALALASQGAERGRIMVWALPTTFERVLTHSMENDWNGYATAGAEAVAVGGLYMAFSYGVGRIFKEAVNIYPETTEAVVDNHPAMVGAISRALDGFPTDEQMRENHPEKPAEGYDVGPYESRETLAGKAALVPVRGIKTGLLFGSTPHVGIAKTNLHSDASTEKRLKTVVAEATGFFATLSAGLATLVIHDSLGMADKIKDTLSNQKLLWGATAGVIGYGILANWMARRKEEKLMTPQEMTDQLSHEELDALEI